MAREPVKTKSLTALGKWYFTPFTITAVSILASELLYLVFYLWSLHEYPTGWYGFVISLVIPLVVAWPSSHFVIKLWKQVELTKGRLEEENEMRSKLLGIISHDVRGPLGVLINLMDLMKADMTKEELFAIMEQLEPQLQFTKDTLDRLTYWVKLRMHESSLEIKRFKLKEIRTEVQRYGDQFSIHRSNALQIEWDDELELETDPNVIIIALTNLVNNAVKHSPESSPVRIISEVHSKSVQIHVVDEGPGIPAKSLEELLEKNQSKTLSKTTESMGVGLFLAKEFMEIGGGKLSAQNIEPKGAQFSITLGRV
ncbi:MAG: ATP-binding protein [Flavobacteriia bacterium]|nr:ATP-binding protein [Flavobacteriia bacterium]